jgi:transcriptional regulator with XRE-family HTH domain
MGIDSILSQKIKQHRKLRRMMQGELAEEIRFTTDYISNIESGRRKVTVENLKRFCECLINVGIEELLPVEVKDDSKVRADWIAEINGMLDLLDTTQLGLVRTMICSLLA